jgi:hypothetical protein
MSLPIRRFYKPFLFSLATDVLFNNLGNLQTLFMVDSPLRMLKLGTLLALKTTVVEFPMEEKHLRDNVGLYLVNFCRSGFYSNSLTHRP